MEAQWEQGRPLAPYTTWRIGGPARLFAEPSDVDRLRATLDRARERGFPVLALGGGSNLLVSDRGYDGLVVHYRGSAQTSDPEPGGAIANVRVEAGARLSSTARSLAREGWAGLEWAEGIPGTIGGAVAGNAGAYGGDFGSVVTFVEELARDGSVRRLTSDEAGFGYRTSRWKLVSPLQGFIVAATLRLTAGDPVALAARVRAIGEERKRKTPAGSSTGSVFQNPPGDSAGRLIEAAGLKGSEAGGAVISTLHANYIVNRGAATARDVLTLIQLARTRVFETSGIRLTPEVRMVGFEPEEIRDLFE